jgi:hypothetical protein
MSRGPIKTANAPGQWSWLMWPAGCVVLLFILTGVATYQMPGNPIHQTVRDITAPALNWNRARTLPTVVRFQSNQINCIQHLVDFETNGRMKAHADREQGGNAVDLALWVKQKDLTGSDMEDIIGETKAQLMDALSLVLRPCQTQLNCRIYRTEVVFDFGDDHLMASAGSLDLKKIDKDLRMLGPYDIVPIDLLYRAWSENEEHWDDLRRRFFPE